MIFSICLFLLGSILCGCAQSINWLVAARVVQGLGGGGCLSLSSVITNDITTLRERPKYLAMNAFAWALGTNTGVSFHDSHLFSKSYVLVEGLIGIKGTNRRSNRRILLVALGVLDQYTHLCDCHYGAHLCAPSASRHFIP